MKISKSKERTLKKGLKTFPGSRVKLPKDCAVARMSHNGDHDGHSLRSFTYKDRQVEVQTRYDVKVDGKPLATKLMVGADGTVHCHALPNYAFSSALDLVREIIDFAKPAPKDELAAIRAKKTAKPARKKTAAKRKSSTRKAKPRKRAKRS